MKVSRENAHERAGLDRTKSILNQQLAKVLLVYKASRLFRQAGKGYQFINEEVVEEGLRAVSVSQGIDTERSQDMETAIADSWHHGRHVA